MPFKPFAMERWQSTFENRVDYNLSESGVHPLTLGELLTLAGEERALETQLGYGQSNGSDELRAHIAALYPGATDAGIVVTNGSAEANFSSFWSLLGPGDTIAIVVPAYMQIYGLAESFGVHVREIPLREELGWQPDPDEIRRVIDGDVRAIVVTNPSNPTGAVLNADARTALVEAARATGAWILADEVYAGAELQGGETPSFFGTHERVIATGSLSKAYGLPGLRIGWAATEPSRAEAIWARTDYTTISPGTLTDRLASLALAPAVRPLLLARTHELVRNGLDVLEQWMNEIGGFRYVRPAAGAIAWTHYDHDIDADTLAERLRVEQSVLIVPGTQFGMDRWIRFGVGEPAAHLRPALDRVGELLQQIPQVSAKG